MLFGGKWQLLFVLVACCFSLDCLTPLELTYYYFGLYFGVVCGLFIVFVVFGCRFAMGLTCGAWRLVGDMVCLGMISM